MLPLRIMTPEDMKTDNEPVPVLDPHIITTLRQLVTAYHSTDSTIKQLRNSLFDQRKVKHDLSARICDIMRSLGLEDIKYSGSMLRYTTRKVTLPPSRAVIKERLQLLFDEPTQKEQAMQMVLAPQGTEERVGIRKVRIRSTRQND